MDKLKDNNKKSKNILIAFSLAFRLMKGSRGQLYFLLTTLVLFNIEVALIMPLILKYGFQAIAANNIHTLWVTFLSGVCVMVFNFIVMYFINVYGDAWVTKFAFHAAENSFKEISRLPVSTIQSNCSDDDLFNRIAAGTGNIMGFYFTIADLLGNGMSVLVLMILLYNLSNVFGGLIVLLVAAELFFVRLQFRYNANYTKKLQQDKAESIKRVRSLLEQLSFHRHNQTWDWMRGLYSDARNQWFLTQGRRTLVNVILDSCLVSIHGFLKTGFIYGFMVKQELFYSYVDDVVSSFSTFDNLVAKANRLSGNISKFPNSLVPIGKLHDVLKEKTQQVSEEGQDCYELTHVSVSIGDKKIIKDISCHVPLKSKVAVIGENGSGKSTLLKTMAGLYQCENGNVYRLGQKVAYIPADDLLFQGHSVFKNISYCIDKIEADAIVKQLEELQFQGVDELCEKSPEQLSGGEAKRINIARGLIGNAEVILADEPTSCLDWKTSQKVVEKLLSLEDKTIIYVTHEPEYAKMADEIIFMQDGKIKQIIKKEEYKNNKYLAAWSKQNLG